MECKPVVLYALSTCVHCRKAKEYLEKCNVPYSCIYVDETQGDARRELIDTVKKNNPRLSFPTILVGSQVLVGFNEKDLKEALSYE